MKKTLIYIAFLFFFTVLVLQGANAQSYSFAPDKTYTIDLRKNEFNEYHIWIINQKSTQLSIHWKLLYNTFDHNESWIYNLCDNVNCYLDIPKQSDMNPVAPGDSAYFKLAFDPSGVEDTASMQLLISDLSNPDKYDTVTFIVNTLHLGIKEYEEGKNIKLYPNPAVDFLNVDLTASGINPVSLVIYNVLGQQVMSMPASMQNLVNISLIPAGSYSICFKDKNGKAAWKQFCKSAR
jgi:hypothetical protein